MHGHSLCKFETYILFYSSKAPNNSHFLNVTFIFNAISLLHPQLSIFLLRLGVNDYCGWLADLVAM